MSKERSSSAVRDLRTIFENKESEASAEQQRPNLSRETSREDRRPLSKVRSSFVVVEKATSMADTTEDIVGQVAESTQESSASLRRASFSENGEDHDQLAALKKVVSQESERRERDSSVAEAIPEAVIEATPAGTPVVEAEKELTLGNKAVPSKLSKSVVPENTSTANPDKPVTAFDEEEVKMQPADPTDATAVAGIEDDARAEPEPTPEPTAEKVAETPVKAAAAHLPAKLASLGSPAAKTTQPARDLSRKVSRSSLTAPTAASVARSSDKRESLVPKSPVKARRESTRPVGVSSHLLAPTAASRARQEADSRAAKTTASKPRASLASRPESQTSHGAKKTPDSSFLDRLTRPTAASQHRAQEKYEPKRKALPIHKKSLPARANGAATDEQSGTTA